MIQIYFYQSRSGKEVVIQFIDSLDITTKVKVRNGIRLLARYGLTLLKDQSVKKLSRRPDIYELRIVSQIQVRVLFTQYDKNTYLILHGFIKKTAKTPLKEIRLAQKRAKEYI